MKQASKQEQNIDEVIEAVKKYILAPQGRSISDSLFQIPPSKEKTPNSQVDINNKVSLEEFLYGRRSDGLFKPELSFDEMQKVYQFFTDEDVLDIMRTRSKKSDDLNNLWKPLCEAIAKRQYFLTAGAGVGMLLGTLVVAVPLTIIGGPGVVIFGLLVSGFAVAIGGALIGIKISLGIHKLIFGEKPDFVENVMKNYTSSYISFLDDVKEAYKNKNAPDAPHETDFNPDEKIINKEKSLSFSSRTSSKDTEYDLPPSAPPPSEHPDNSDDHKPPSYTP